jgi:hypothetical protein
VWEDKYEATRVGQKIHAKGYRAGDRVFKPHEQIEVTRLLLTRTAMLEMAKKYNAKKLRVPVGIAYVDFTTGDKFTSRSGPPDWQDENVERTNVLDAEDAARQACN